MKLLITILSVVSVISCSFGCGSDNDVVNEVLAVEGTKLLTLQTDVFIDRLRGGDAETVVGRTCSSTTLAVGGGCVVRSFDGGKPVQSLDSFLNQELQAFTCMIENDSQENSLDILVTIQTICSDIN